MVMMAGLFGIKAEAIDPKLAALFASSAGPVQAPEISHEASDLKSLEENEQSNSGKEQENVDEDDAGQEQLRGKSNATDEAGRRETIKRVRKRKNREQDDNLEGAYMAQLAKEEAKEEQRKLKHATKRQKTEAPEIESPEASSTDGDVEENEDEDDALSETSELDSNAASEAAVTDEEDEADEQNETTPPPLHESLVTDLSKASRTVFLSNVSVTAVTSKSARKVLLAHLSSFFSTLPTSTPAHKVSSLRFRSVPFSSAAVPKKASFVHGDVMPATTKSTNAYAVYSTEAAARKAIATLNGSIVLDRHLRVDSVAHPQKIDHRRCVFVGNLGFVDDESLMRASSAATADPANENDKEEKKRRKSTEKSLAKHSQTDVEEGLWRTFSKCGTVESVRVVRDKVTRVGKGFAYVQFADSTAVETALLNHDKSFPPLLPRKLRVVRAKSLAKTANFHKRQHGSQRSNSTFDKSASTLRGRAGKLLGAGGAAKFRDANHHTPRNPEKFVFEGHRASSKHHDRASANSTSTASSKSKPGRKTGKPQTRSARRGAAFKASGGLKSKGK